jgi:hypothetical protein
VRVISALETPSKPEEFDSEPWMNTDLHEFALLRPPAARDRAINVRNGIRIRAYPCSCVVETGLI